MNRIFTFLTILLTLSLHQRVFSQGGSTCGTAVKVIPGEIIAKQATPQFYIFNALQDQAVTLSACNATVNYTVTVTEGCSTKVDTFMSKCSSGTKKQISFVAEGGKSYIIQWNSDGNATQSYNWTLATRALAAGETPATAITAVVGSTNDYNTTSSLPLWYKYTAASNLRIEITNCDAPYAYFTKIYASLNLTDSVETFDNNCGSVQHATRFFYVNGGQTYYIRWRNPSYGGNLQFNWSLTENPLVLGETCGNPETLAIGTDANVSGGDYMKWFTYTNSTGNPQRIEINPCSPSTNTGSFYSQVRNSCGEADFERSVKHVLCGDNSNTTQFIALPGRTYYIKVYPTSFSNFTVTNTVPAQGEVCANPKTAVVGTNHSNHLTNTDQWFVFTSPDPGTLNLSGSWGSTHIQFYTDCSHGAVAYDQTSREIPANTPLYILFRNSASVEYDWTLAFTPVTPGSDYTSAIPITTDGAQTSGNINDVWYKYTPAADSRITVSTCGTNSHRTVLEMRDQDHYFMGSNSLSCGTPQDQTSGEVLVEAGKTLYIHWSAPVGGNIDEWNLTVVPATIPQGYVCSNPLSVSGNGTKTETIIAFQPWIWYLFTAPANGTLVVDNAGTVPGYSTKVLLLGSECYVNNGNVLMMGTDGSINESALSYHLESGQQVKIGWKLDNPNSLSFVWHLNFLNDGAAPAGYSCSNPATASVGSNSANTINGDEFFNYTPANAGHLKISTFGLYSKDTKVAVYQTCEDYSRTNAESGLNNPLASKVLTGGVDDGLELDCGAGNTYLIVWTKGYTSETFNWNLAYTSVSNAAEITDFGINLQEGTSTITSGAGTIDVTMPYNTNRTVLTPTFTLSNGAVAKISGVSQVSGVTANNYTNAVTYTVTAEDGVTTKDWTVTVTNAPNHAAEITDFTILNQEGTTTITTGTTGSVTLKVPYGTSLTSLTPTFTLSAGATAKVGSVTQTSGSTSNNFTAAVTYVITAQDGTTTKNWTVTVTNALNKAAEIIDFTILNQEGTTTITTGTTGSVTLKVPYGTSLTSLTPTFTLSAGATAKVGSVTQTSGSTSNNFTAAVTYVITAQDGTTTKNWTVTVTNAPNHAAEITDFTILNQEGTTTITTGTTGSVTLKVPYGTSLTSLTPTFTLSAGATAKVGSVTQTSGSTSNNFTAAVTYVITAQDGTTTKNWTVTVTNALNKAAEIIDFTILNQEGTTTITTGTTGSVTLKVPYGTSLTSLTPTFTLSAGATAKVGSVTQTSGSTSNNFTAAVTYVITAQDGTTTKNWTVTVTNALNKATEITDFTILNQEGTTTITTGTTGSVTLKVPYGTSLTSLTPTFTLSAGATAKVGSVAQTSGSTSNNFTAAVTYVITAQDGTTTKNWTVNVTNAPNHAAEITAFDISGKEVAATLGTSSVTLQMPYGTDLSSLIPTFALSDGATAKVGSVTQSSGSTSNNFTAAVTYAITAQDGTTTKNWTVNVTNAPNHAAEITAFDISGREVAPTLGTSSITLQMPYGTDLSSLIPTFALSDGATAKVGSVTQTSGSTSNDFTAAVTYVITAQDGTTTKNWTVNVTNAPNHAAEITAFDISGREVAATLGASSITLQMPYGTDLSSLVPAFTLSDGATAKVGSVTQTSGSTSNDFRTAVTYVVTAQDGTTSKDWTVAVTNAPNHASDITLFNIPNQEVQTVISNVNKTISVTLPYGSAVTALVPTFETSYGAKVKVGGTDQVSGITANNFASPLTYTVVAEDGTSSSNWTVTVSVGQNHATSIVSYSIPNQVGNAVIDNVKGTIDISMPYGTNVTALVATFGLSQGASAKIGSTDQQSGVTANNFTSSVIYTVTAQDASTTQNWTVIVTVAKNTESSITAFTVNNQVHPTTIDAAAKTVTIKVPVGTDLTSIVPTFTLSAGAVAKVNDQLQTSGTTANNFTNNVTYKVIAEDGVTFTNWVVSISPNTATFEIGNELVKVYPNPASSFIYVTIPNSMEGNWNVKIVNISGKLMYDTNLQFTDGENLINLPNLKNGVYSVKLSNNGQTLIYKLVINN